MSKKTADSGRTQVRLDVHATLTPSGGDPNLKNVTEKLSDTFTIALQNLRTTDDLRAAARVRMGVALNVSDADYYGPGDWDKIHYKVGTEASVELVADKANIAIAQNVAFELAQGAANKFQKMAVVSHRKQLREIYPEKEWAFDVYED